MYSLSRPLQRTARMLAAHQSCGCATPWYAPDEHLVTLTFPRDDASTEDQAHQALRKLVARLRYRELLDTYAWGLERQDNGNPSGASRVERLGALHCHAIFHTPFLDGLDEWRALIVASGFGPWSALRTRRRPPSEGIWKTR